jgi:nucleoside-diphosphate-sugar epimerase
MARIVIAGCGYVGTALGLELADEGHEVFGLRRDPSKLPPRIEPLAADLARRESLLVLPERIDAAVYCVSPDSAADRDYRIAYLDGLECFLRTLEEQGEKPRRVLFTSSTSVYAQDRGERVDESSPARPRSASGETLILAERLLLAAGFPAAVVRFGGIYGPGRTRLVEQVARGEARLEPEPHFTNRIHRDDAAGILHHLIAGEPAHALYLGVDCEPADEADLLRFLAGELGVAAPQPRGSADPPPGRRAGSKRCRNDRIRAEGYRFRVPGYRDGYPEIVRESLRARAAGAVLVPARTP